MAGFRRSSRKRGSAIRRRKTWDRWIATSSGIQDTGAPGVSDVQVGWIDEPHGRQMTDTIGIIRTVDETLLRMIVSFDFSACVSGTTLAGAVPAFNMGWMGAGLLVWDGIDGLNTPSLLDVPWPVSGAGPGEEADWIWTFKRTWSSLPVISSSIEQDESVFSSRAKRKLSSGAGILLITEVFSFSTAVEYQWVGTGRSIYNLP